MLAVLSAAALVAAFVTLGATSSSRAAPAPASPVTQGDEGSGEGAAGGEHGLTSELMAPLEWRNIGPAVTGGRTVDFAVVESDPDVIYAATASGGAWKTTDRGVTWKPVFGDQGTTSLGDVTLSPSNPNVVWVGTGEPNNQRSSSWGNGVYRSEDGGGTWEHMGLDGTRHVGRIVVHPEDDDVVYVAALGSLWGSDEHRGLYRTTDGGESWEKILYVDEHTGVVDLTMDPRDPDLLYVATYQRQRRNWSFVGGGPGSGLYRSEDGGDTWEELSVGLPSGEMGKIGLSICRSRPDTVYATVQAKRKGGIYRSDDRGASWQFKNPVNQTPWYYSQVRCDPNDPDRVYTLGTFLMLSEDGGENFENVHPRNVHVDHHGMWIDPADSDHIVLGNDGGIYISWDGGGTWDFMPNLPITQFYTVTVDLQEPFYYVYGGTQDNNTWGGPSGTRNSEGIVNADWYVTVGGDGFYAQVDPQDPTIVYSEWQYGNLVRFDSETGERRDIKPREPEGEHYRWNWSSPLLISPHDHETLYFAANVVFKSTDQGDSWEVISPDLTRQLGRDELPLMGKTWDEDAISRHEGTSEYGNITTMVESPLQAGVLAVGTDDGLIQLTRDDGESWTEIPSESLPGVPELSRVSRLVLSNHDPETIYATFDRHKDDDFRPYVYVSRDFGETWTNITGDLPEFGSTRVIVEHRDNPDLLFVGTEFGVYVTVDGGGHWAEIDNGFPTVAVHDIVVHPRENDLVLGTHGRGFWILDDVTILEELTPGTMESTAHLASVRPATQFHDFQRGMGSQGDQFFSAPNPPRGAILTYWVNPEVMERPEGAEGAMTEESAVPSREDGEGEGEGSRADEESGEGDSAQGNDADTGDDGGWKPPKIHIDVLDPDGRVVRRLDAPQGKGGTGIQRLVWDLRHRPPYQPEEGQRSWFGPPTGPFVLPGDYTVRLTVGDSEVTRTVAVEGDPFIDIPDDVRRVWHDALVALNEMRRSVRGATSTAEEIRGRMKAVQEELAQHPGAPENLSEQAEEISQTADDVLERLRGPEEGQPEPTAPEPLSELVTRLYYGVEGSTAMPTEVQRRQTRRAHERLAEEVGTLNLLLNERIPALHRALDEAGIPWTPGRSLGVPPEELLPPAPQ